MSGLWELNCYTGSMAVGCHGRQPHGVPIVTAAGAVPAGASSRVESGPWTFDGGFNCEINWRTKWAKSQVEVLPLASDLTRA